MSIKNVMLIGAGGNVGPSILDALLKSSSFDVTVLSRQDSKSTFPSGVRVVRADYDSIDSLTAAFKGQDAIVSTIASASLAAQTKLIDAAVAAGVKHYIPSEFGSNTADPRVLEAVPAFGDKVSIQNYLKSKQNEIGWNSVICGPFFDWGLKVGFLGVDASTKTATLIDDGTALFSATNLRKVGQTVVKILENTETMKNQLVYVSSFDTTQRDILAVAEKVTGEKWTVKNVTAQSVRESGFKKLEQNDFSGIGELIQAAISGKEGLSDISTLAAQWNGKLGLQKEDFEESVKTALSGNLV